jgi:hypothetical protein
LASSPTDLFKDAGGDARHRHGCMFKDAGGTHGVSTEFLNGRGRILI